MLGAATTLGQRDLLEIEALEAVLPHAGASSCKSTVMRAAEADIPAGRHNHDGSVAYRGGVRNRQNARLNFACAA